MGSSVDQISDARETRCSRVQTHYRQELELPLREPGIVLPSFLRIEPKDTAVKPHPQSLGRLIYWERQRFRRLEHIDNGRVRPPRQAQL